MKFFENRGRHLTQFVFFTSSDLYDFYTILYQTTYGFVDFYYTFFLNITNLYFLNVIVIGHSYTGDSNGYDYSNTGTNNGYLGSKDSYQNGGNFYAGGNHEVSNYVGNGHSSLINSENQGNIEGDSYSGYSSSNNHESEYAGYSNTYENSNSDSYILSTRATPTSFRGYSNNNNGDSAFKAYSSDSSIYKDSDFGNQYATSSSTVNNKRTPYSAGYSRPTMLKNYQKGSVSEGLQGYHDSSDVSSYSENDHVYSSYLPDNLAGEHSFGRQRDGPYGLKSGGKYNDVYPMLSETRYTRGNTGNIGNAGHMSYNHDISSYASRPNNYFSKTPGAYFSSGKPSKYYGYSKYLSRHAPNSGMTYYLSRDRDDYYAPSSYGKGGGKVIIIKNNRPGYDGGHVYSDEPSLYSGSYRSKSGGLMTGYSASPTFDGYNAGSDGYDDSRTLTRRYRNSGGPLLVQRSIYSL